MGDTFTFTFLKTVYPLLEKPKDYDTVKEIEQRPVAQIVVTVDQMARNINVFNKNFKKFLMKQDPEVRELLNEIAELPLTEEEKQQAAVEEE